MRIVALRDVDRHLISERRNIRPIQIITIAIIVALVFSAYSTFYYYSSDQKLTSDVTAMNQSLSSLNDNYNQLSQQYQISLSNLLNIMQQSQLNTTMHPPISELQALQIAFNYGGWRATSLQGYQVTSIELYNLTIWHYGGSWGIDTQPVTEPPTHWSSATIVNATYPSIYTTYSYAWQIEIQRSTGILSIPPPGYYYVDAANGDVFDLGNMMA
jgi:hypothetical protein